jgi:hypothetical protein
MASPAAEPAISSEAAAREISAHHAVEERLPGSRWLMWFAIIDEGACNGGRFVSRPTIR